MIYLVIFSSMRRSKKSIHVYKKDLKGHYTFGNNFHEKETFFHFIRNILAIIIWLNRNIVGLFLHNVKGFHKKMMTR
jgi:hypothetical protein